MRPNRQKSVLFRFAPKHWWKVLFPEVASPQLIVYTTLNQRWGASPNALFGLILPHYPHFLAFSSFLCFSCNKLEKAYFNQQRPNSSQNKQQSISLFVYLSIDKIPCRFKNLLSLGAIL